MNKHLKTSIHAVHAELPSFSEAGVPEWVHLLPTSNGAVQTFDKRGPYNVADPELIIQNSFAEVDKLPIDQDHAMDLAAKEGRPAPARGWIVAMQSREDGIWGQVEWTPTGRALLEERAYSKLSPVIDHANAPGQEIVQNKKASLVNRPNLRGMNSLNQESDTMFQETIAKLLGLKPDASESDITAALKALKGKGGSKNETALQSQLGEIAVALGCASDADPAAIVTAAQSAGVDESDTITALQSTVTELSKTVTSLQAGTKLSAAETFVDGAIKEMRVGVSASRDHFITLHQRDPEGTEALIGKLPQLDASHTTIVPPASNDGATTLNAEETSVATLLGLSTEEMAGKSEASK